LGHPYVEYEVLGFVEFRLSSLIEAGFGLGADDIYSNLVFCKEEEDDGYI